MSQRLLRVVRSLNGWLLVPLFVAVVTHIRTLWGGFVWDDEYYLGKWIVTGNTLREVLMPGNAQEGIPYYRPVASLSGMVLYRLSGGGAPWLWHASNLLFHVLSTAGVYVLLRSWVAGGTGRFEDRSEKPLNQDHRAQFACAAGAVLFACWPANVEAIVWISARTEGIMACLVVWALVLHLCARDSGRTSLPAAVLFLLALLSKETAVVFLPLAAAATALLPASRGAERTGFRAGIASSLWLPHLLAYASYTALRRAALGKATDTSLITIAGERLKPEAIEPAVRAWGYYLREALLLGPGAPYTEFPPTGPWMLLFGIAGVSAGSLVIGVSLRRRAWRPWCMAVVWFVLALGPPIAMAVDPLSVTAVAMRYLYLSNVALAAFAALVVVRLPDPGERKRIVWAFAAGVVFGLVVLAQVRMTPWMSSHALWLRAVEDEPTSAITQLNLGLVYLEEGNILEGENHLRIAAYGSNEIDTNRKQTSLVRLAEFYVSRGELQLARVALLKASTLRGSVQGTATAMALAATLEMLEHRATDDSMVSRVPRNRLLQQIAPLEHAASLDPTDTSSRLVLAVVNEALGEKARARGGYLALSRIAASNKPLRTASLERAHRLAAEIAAEADPVKRLYFEAQGHEQAGEWKEAVHSYEAALALAPERSDLLTPLAEIEARTGNLPAAVSLMVRATDADPENPFQWFNLGLYRSLLSDGKGADEAYRRASELLPRWWRPYFQRAGIRETAGDRAGAVEQYERMLEVFDGVEPFRDFARTKVRELREEIGRNPSPTPSPGDVF